MCCAAVRVLILCLVGGEWNLSMLKCRSVRIKRVAITTSQMILRDEVLRKEIRIGGSPTIVPPQD